MKKRLQNNIQCMLEARNYHVEKIDVMDLPEPPKNKKSVGLIVAYYVKAQHKENNNLINRFIFNAEYKDGRQSWIVGEYEVEDINKAIEKMIWMSW